MNDTYPSLLDILDEIAKKGYSYRKPNDDRIFVITEESNYVFGRMEDNTWQRYKVGF